jgi:hypothetical protein
MADNSRAINRVFTKGVLTDLLKKGRNDVFDYVVARYVNDPECKTHGQIFSEIYTFLGEQKRNEYYYMNTLLNRILIGYHSVNTTCALSQVRIGQHIADFVMINGEGKVYEIKSNLDNFDRLSDQLSDYFRAFSKVSVLTTPHEYERLTVRLRNLGELGNAVGIFIMNEKGIFFNNSYRREPKLFVDNLEHSCMFKLLRKREYENVIRRYYGELPVTVPVQHFRECLKWFLNIPILMAQDFTCKELKKRNIITRTEYNNIQTELKSVVYFSGFSNKLSNVERLLQTVYRR